VEDETIIRLFPPLHSSWAKRGEQAQVPITGRNAKRVLQGTINLETGHRVLLRQVNRKYENFGLYLRELRRRYKGRPIWMLLDRDPSHTAQKNQHLAKDLNIRLIWLPKQCSELHPMDHLWREMKKDVLSNHQYKSIEEAAASAEGWVRTLSRWQVFQKAGLFSTNCWLKDP
jgi:transposase